MPTNPGYVDAEARVFGGYKLFPTVHMLSLAQPRLRVRAVEVGAGEPMVFLHGFSHCTAHWAPLVSRLSGMRSLMLDAPGHAASDAVNFRGVNLRAWYKEMLISCLDALGLEQVRLIGHSQGAMQALWLALDAPSRVRSVVAIGVPAVAFGARLDAIRFLARPVVGPLLLWLPPPPSVYRNILAGTMGPAAVRAHPELVRATYPATHRAGYAKTVFTYLQEMFRGADAEPRRYALSDAELQRIAQPVLCSGAAKTPSSSRLRRRKPGRRGFRTAASKSSQAVTSPGSTTSKPAPVSSLHSIRVSGWGCETARRH
jgi:pimeloyl-ACP methyl ester carboxylesterase